MEANVSFLKYWGKISFKNWVTAVRVLTGVAKWDNIPSALCVFQNLLNQKQEGWGSVLVEARSGSWGDR